MKKFRLNVCLKSWHIYFQAKESFWKAQRSATNPIMARPQRVLSYLSTQNDIIDEFIQIIKEDLKKASDQPVTIKKFQNRIKYLNLECKFFSLSIGYRD